MLVCIIHSHSTQLAATCPDWDNGFPTGNGGRAGKRTVFSTHSRIGGHQWPTQSQPRCFQSGAQRRPCCLSAPFGYTHPPPPILPFLLKQNLSPKVTAESDITRWKFHAGYISGYVWERVNPPPTICHLKVSLYIQLWIPFAAPSTTTQ